nr:DUF945 family protein [Halomonas sp. MCCC 1A17488]
MAAVVGLALIAGLGAPHWMGRQIERQYADYLHQFGSLEYIQIENPSYERGWFEARASYELVLEPEFAQAYQRLLAEDMALELEGEPLRIAISDRIVHGPFMGALARLEGRIEASGWLFDQLVQWEEAGALSRYEASVGFDRVVKGEWAPQEMTLVAGPLLSEAGFDMRYVADYLGGDFRYDPTMGEYRSSNRLGQARLEEPGAVHTFEGATSNLVVSFPQGVLREVTFTSDDGPMLSQSRDPAQTGDSRIDGQNVEVQLDFDEQGRFASVDSRFAMRGFEAEEPELFLTLQGIEADFKATRQGETSWYGQLGLNLDGMTVRQQQSPGFEAQSVNYRLDVEPESDSQFRVAQLVASRDLRIQGMEEPIAFHLESSYGQLPREAYDTLWQLVYEAIDVFSLDDPDAVLPVFERIEQASETLMAGRSAFTFKPVSFSIGDADADLSLDADLALEDLDAFDQHKLLAPDNRLDLSVNASALLLHKVARESLRQQYGVMISDNELDAMAKEMVAQGLQPMLELGVVRREEGDRYSLHLQLEDGQLRMNGEPGEWLLGQF